MHERRDPQAFEVFVAANRDDLDARKTLMLSVSQSAAFANGKEEAQDYVTKLELCVARAFKTGSYDDFATEVVRDVLLHGRDEDPGDGEHEFIDWKALATALDSFIKG